MKKMSNKTKTRNLASGENKTKSKHLIKRTELPNTPFVIVKIEKNENIITMGKYKMVNKSFETLEQAENYIKENTWDLIATFVSIVTDETVKEILKN